MADPKKGYKPGIYRLVSGTIDADGNFSATNVPKAGFVPGIYKLTQVTVDGNGDLSAASEDVGVTASITVTVDAAGDPSVTDTPQEGYVPGFYRVSTSTNEPKEGFIEAFTAVVGTITSGVWSASAVPANALLETTTGATLLETTTGTVLLET